MSRIGNNPITIPLGVTVKVEGQTITTKGPLGELKLHAQPQVTLEVADNQINVTRKKDDKISRSLHGLTRALIANMVTGVEKGWEKRLELVGVGFRAQTTGEKLTLNIGFSHPAEVVAPAGIKFTVTDNTKIIVSGIRKDLVGQIAASIRKIKPPEPYQGKGIRYTGEYVRRKQGKTGKVGGK